ncbi:unnamed protein product [Caenorhabditis brenneri]
MIVYAIYGKFSAISYFTTFVALLTVPVILLYIVLPRVRTCFLRGSSKIPDYAKSVLITHFILITIGYYLTTQNKFRSYATADGIAIAQFCFVILSCTFICYGWVIEENGFKLISERALTEVVIKQKAEDIPEPLEEESDTFRFKELECKICLQRYHSKIKRRTPRMLKQCDHSLCEGCADDLLNKNDQDFINCPFCTTKTDVFGPAWFLPKNFAVIEMLEELKELEVKPKNV